MVTYGHLSSLNLRITFETSNHNCITHTQVNYESNKNDHKHNKISKLLPQEICGEVLGEYEW